MTADRTRAPREGHTGALHERPPTMLRRPGVFILTVAFIAIACGRDTVPPGASVSLAPCAHGADIETGYRYRTRIPYSSNGQTLDVYHPLTGTSWPTVMSIARVMSTAASAPPPPATTHRDAS